MRNRLRLISIAIKSGMRLEYFLRICKGKIACVDQGKDLLLGLGLGQV